MFVQVKTINKSVTIETGALFIITNKIWLKT